MGSFLWFMTYKTWMKPIYKGMILCPLNLKTYEENKSKSVSAGKNHGRIVNAGSLFPPVMFISAKILLHLTTIPWNTSHKHLYLSNLLNSDFFRVVLVAILKSLLVKMGWTPIAHLINWPKNTDTFTWVYFSHNYYFSES